MKPIHSFNFHIHEISILHWIRNKNMSASDLGGQSWTVYPFTLRPWRPLYWQLSSTDAFQNPDHWSLMLYFSLVTQLFCPLRRAAAPPSLFPSFFLLDKWSLEKLKEAENLFSSLFVKLWLCVNLITVAWGWLRERQQRHVLLIKGTKSAVASKLANSNI